ncbi:alpha-ketoglutarate-dependent dioxygenase alkB homolog 7, mitochondrial isoform X1 [Hippopotamus amphibius kiboko]|uniref:alpha-ketoglutarate-dependent dioxygenase alkB homolog 7, mitochondrial isoform X1 n=1 Tax=Hippopotamus amphibius kiboko TaxID=575201 RepID=UPI0025924EB2|nr:alpha-ketoglutarate-dependent dioxygenase alkB homolog 7, mitochondrial isoform X1 [Hippopotamus amphibius kiboko]
MAGSERLALRTLSGQGWVRGSGPAVLSRLRDAAVVRPGFLSAAEEETLSRELEPELRRRRYEYDHWDAAIHGFRETEKSRWSEASRAILQRVQAAAFGPGQTLLSSVHVLDLEPRGYIKPHVDSIKFCGSTIAGLSLLSPSIMRLVHTQEPGAWLELLLEPGSLYILSPDSGLHPPSQAVCLEPGLPSPHPATASVFSRRGSARYDFSHEILRDEESFFGEQRVPRGRRISVICRSLPEGVGPGEPGQRPPAC